MFKGKGVPASELRPFSIDDPDGSGRGGPSAAERRILEMRRRLKERRARSRKDEAALQRRPARTSNAEKGSRAEREARAASAPIVTASVVPAQLRRTAMALAPNAPADQRGSPGRKSPEPEQFARTNAGRHQPKRLRASQKKKGGCGCLGCLPLLLLGAFLFSAAPQAVNFVEHQVRNEMLRHEGVPAPAQILAVERRGFPVNDRELYELTLEVHSADGRSTHATVQQFFPAHVAQHLRLASWVQVHVDPQDPSRAVVLSVRHAPPSRAAPRPTQHL